MGSLHHGLFKGSQDGAGPLYFAGEMPTTIAVSLAEADLPELMPSFDGITTSGLNIDSP
jgi:hypothetical protein